MKCLYLFRVLNRTCGISCKRGVRTGAVVLARGRARNVPRVAGREPGLKFIEAALPENSDVFEEIENEEDLYEELDPMVLDKAYDMDQLDEKKEREKLGRIITFKKFFKGPKHPSTLTCNERECIRYLHKTDPVHWNVQTLSESFPATPETIRKVLRARYKIDPERKKKIDSRVQKNWELLAEGKLEAPPEVLEHLKKFINRKEVLLEQIKRADFYLPEMKEEVVWNNGEMSNILVHYEKAIQKLAETHESQSGKKLIGESHSSASKIKEQRETYTEKKENFEFLKNKCSLFNDRTKFNVSNEKAMSDLNSEADARHLSSPSRNFEKKFDVKKEFAFSNKYVTNFSESNAKAQFNHLSKPKKTFSLSHEIGNAEDLSFPDEDFPERPDDTKFILSNELGKVFNEISAKAEAEPSLNRNLKQESDVEDSNKKSYAHVSEKLRREAEYFENEVKDIKNTAFWNSSRTSQEKACAESEKMPLGGPDIFGRGNFSSSEAYPERIHIPKEKRGSGLTFRVRDCYYDDDGRFLYRVPGMVK